MPGGKRKATLQDANQDLSILLAGTRIATLFLDSGFHIRRFTPAAAKLFQLIASDVGRPITDIASVFIDPQLTIDAAAVLEHLEPISREVHGDDERWYVRQTLPYMTPGGQVDGVVVTVSDVAGGPPQEASLFAEAIVDTVREPLLILDGDLRVRSANRSFYATFGGSRRDTPGQLLTELHGGGWNDAQLAQLLGEVWSNGTVLDGFEMTREVEALGRRTLLLNGRAIQRPGGYPRLILLAIEDITERQRAEAALRESESRTRAIVDTAADGIMTLDKTGTVLTFNPAAERIFGYSAAAMIGQNVSTLLPGLRTDLPRLLAAEAQASAGVGHEMVGQRSDGTLFPLDMAVSQHDGAGAVRFTGIVRDISARKRAEEEARQRQADMAHLLRVTTLGELTASLAHEINQPLTAIANDVDACARRVRGGDVDPAVVLPLLDRAVAQAVHAGSIIHHMREFIQRRAPRLEQVDLAQIVQNAATLLAVDVRRCNIALELELLPMPLPLRVDRIQIEQVLVNVMQNAVDALREVPDNARTLRVRTTHDGNGMAGVVIRDTGSGIPPAAAQRLFEPFFSTKPHGLGMGLAISRTIVEAHAGRLSVEPARHGPGTTVCLLLPLDRDSAAHQQA